MIKDLINEAHLYTTFRHCSNIENIMNAYKKEDLTNLRIEIDKAMDESIYDFTNTLTEEMVVEHNEKVEHWHEMCNLDNIVIEQLLKENNGDYMGQSRIARAKT